MNKKTYENFTAAGSKIIEVNDVMIEAIAALKADYNELCKINAGNKNAESSDFVKGKILELEVTQNNSYLAQIIVHDKILELNSMIILEVELAKALEQ